MKLLLVSSSTILVVLVLIQEGKSEKVPPSEDTVSVPIKATNGGWGGCICYEDLFQPICANDGKTYSNPCILNCARRQQPFLLGVCEGECPCCKPPYYNEPLQNQGWKTPMEGIGGDDGMEKTESDAKLEKEEDHVKLVGFMSSGSNSGWQSGCYCTEIYKPVCGSNNQTYGNLCSLLCSAKTDTCLTQACDGKCPCCSCNKNVVYSPPEKKTPFLF